MLAVNPIMLYCDYYTSIDMSKFNKKKEKEKKNELINHRCVTSYDEKKIPSDKRHIAGVCLSQNHY